MKKLIIFLVLTGFYHTVTAQGIFPEKNVIDSITPSYIVLSADFDGDGDMDVLSVFNDPYKIVWYKNDGEGNFGDENFITTNSLFTKSVFAADIDGDDDMDVLSASSDDNKIAWYENDGTGNFGNQKIITTNIDSPISVYAADLDDDGDVDVLSGSVYEINWNENDGNGNFGDQHLISNNASYAVSVFATDLDGDGDPDILYASLYDNKVAWHENYGNGNFGGQSIIDTNFILLRTLYPTDIDGDEDVDILAGTNTGLNISWLENDGTGIFESHALPDSGAYINVFASDLDRDGDMDVISSSNLIVKNVAWYENDGNGNFGNQNYIGDSADYARSVYAADLDGDGDDDVLCGMPDGLFWYENSTYSYTQPSDRQCCFGSSVEFSIGNAINVQSYQWQKFNGSLFENLSDDEHFSGTTTQTLTINGATWEMNNERYRCLLTIEGNQVASKEAVLTILPLPETQDIIGNPNPAPYDTCTYAVPNPGNSGFEWSVEGGSIIGGTVNSKDIKWGEAGYGSLSVIEIDTNGCQGLPVHLAIIIDVEELFAKYNIRIFPNPTSGQIRIDGDNIQKVEILTAGGKPVRRIVPKDKDIEIDMSTEPKGLYFITFILKDRTLVRKLILK